jgi:hypothetical protein
VDHACVLEKVTINLTPEGILSPRNVSRKKKGNVQSKTNRCRRVLKEERASYYQQN